MKTPGAVRLAISAIASVVALLLAAPCAHAACNLIPQAQPAFRGALGTVDRPYAAPGDFVDVHTRPTLCDAASPGVGVTASQHEVTLLFEPVGGTKRAVLLTTEPCAGVAPRLDACENASGIESASCIQVNQPSELLGLGVVVTSGENHLRFRFPNTDALLAPDGDRRGFAGPVTIAVTSAGDPLPCGLATSTCAAQARTLGMVACIDDLYESDGTCQPNAGDVFPSFTALPEANDFQADCFDASPPCTATATELRFALDGAGNLLFPVYWQGVLPSTVQNPIPRLLRATVRPPVPVTVPDRTFLSSFTPEGQPLPPIFEPQDDPSVATPGTLAIFGSADAPATVLRIAQRRGTCVGGPADGEPCRGDAQCRNGSCQSACVGGSNDGSVCTTDKQCAGGVCGDLYDAEAFLAAIDEGGPLAIERVAAPMPGICQEAPFDACGSNADCGVVPCVTYAFQAEDPVSLESLTAGSDELLALSAPEGLAIVDRTGDGDINDFALTIRDRATGLVRPLGAADGFTGPMPLPGCGLPGTPAGRALVRVATGNLTATALATEDDVVAFLESENGSGFCDQNGDGDHADGIVRVFTVTGNEPSAGVSPPRAADPALVIDDHSIGVSGGKVFFRTSEAAMARHLTERVSGATGLPGGEPSDASYHGTLSKDGRWVAFVSVADDLIGPGADTNGATDAFVRDRVTGVTTRVSVTSAGAQTGNAVDGGVGFYAAVSGDGRYVAFDSHADDLVPGDTNVCFSGPCSDVFVHDRDSDENGIFDEPGGIATTRVSVGPLGAEGDGHSTRPVISANGRVVVFQSDATTLVADDTNADADIFAWDRDTGTVERISVADDERQNTGVQSETRFYDVTDDGRIVLFDLRSTNLPGGDPGSHSGPMIDIFVRDRVAGTTEQPIYDLSEGWLPSQFASQPRMSGDGRYLVFLNQPDFSGQGEIRIYDRFGWAVELANVPVIPGGPAYATAGPDVSDDGRFVSFWSDGFNLVGGDSNGQWDLFVRDRVVGSIERANVVTATGGLESAGELGPQESMISADGREVLFVAAAPNLLGQGVDSNGVRDVFIHGIDAADTADVDALLFEDGSLDDAVLESIDAASGTITTLCPASAVTLASGRAAFLRPEVTVGTDACPAGPLNGDGDTDDQVVQLWPGTGAVESLGKAATAVALSSTHVAAIVSEAGEGAILNDDGDQGEGVVAVKPVAGGAWVNVGQAADRIVFCGSLLAILTSEGAQNGTPLNGDGDALDRVVQVYVPATDTLVNVGQAAEELACNDQVLAFLTSEEAQNQDLQDGVGQPSGFWDTTVIQGYDLGRPECLTPGHPADCLGNSMRQAYVCDFAACDPSVPFQVSGTTIKFISSECEQRGNTPGSCEVTGSDLNGDLDPHDTLLQAFDVRARTVRVLGAVGFGDDDPFQSAAAPEEGTIAPVSGRCLESFGGPCADASQCAPSQTCVAGTCYREHRTCVADFDCPAGVPCLTDVAPVVAASPDNDGDGVPDHLDNCDWDANATQADGDGDGAGDACDLATCGDGVRTYDEVCETGDDALCPGACTNCRCAVCADVVVDPKAKVQVKTKKEAGQLGAGVTLPLGSYTDEPVTIALGDGDSPVIAEQTIGSLPPAGKAPFKKWVFKPKIKSGLVQVQLQSRGPKAPGQYKLLVKAKRWFASGDADQPADATHLTVTIGTACYRIPVTQKSD